MPTLYRRTIAGFSGSWGSGIAYLNFTDGTSVPADSGPLGRALGRAYGAEGPGHTINNAAIAGQDVVWYRDDMGICLGGFVRWEDWEAEDGRDIPEEGLEV